MLKLMFISNLFLFDYSTEWHLLLCEIAPKLSCENLESNAKYLLY